MKVGGYRFSDYRLCRERDEKGYNCTRRKGHKGDHIARGSTKGEGVYARWTGEVAT